MLRRKSEVTSNASPTQSRMTGAMSDTTETPMASPAMPNTSSTAPQIMSPPAAIKLHTNLERSASVCSVPVMSVFLA